VQCGRVLEDTAFSADITFQKDAGGESTVMGQFVNESGVARGIGRIHGGRVYAFQADSHEKAQQRGRHDIAHLVDMLSVRPREESIESGGWVPAATVPCCCIQQAAHASRPASLPSVELASPASPLLLLTCSTS
jgi:hypothetical protein